MSELPLSTFTPIPDLAPRLDRDEALRAIERVRIKVAILRQDVADHFDQVDARTTIQAS